MLFFLIFFRVKGGVAPTPSIPYSPFLCLVSVIRFKGTQTFLGGRGKGSPQRFPPKSSSPVSQHPPLPARAELAEVSEGGCCGGGLMGWEWWKQTGWSNTSGWLCSGLLFAAPQASGLLLVAHTHLLGDVHQSAGHCQTCTDTQIKLQLGGDYTKMCMPLASYFVIYTFQDGCNFFNKFLEK